MIQESNFIILENSIYLNVFHYNETENQFKKIFCKKKNEKNKLILQLD